MEVESKDYIGIIGTVITTVLAFLLGKSGIVKRYFDNRLSKVERQQKREETEVEKTKEENVQLHKLVEQLTTKVAELEKELATTNLKLTILVAYFEKNQPEGDIFIEELKKTMNQK